MRNDRRNYVAVGGFVLAMLAGLLIWIAVLAGRTGAKDAYSILYDNVMGLSSGTQVFFEGYPVGVIEGISPVESDGRQRFQVDLSIRRGWRIPEDSLAAITTSGLLAAVVVEIRSGDSPRMLEPGQAITGLEVPNVFAVFSSVAGELVDLTQNSLKPLLEGLASGAPGIISNLEAFTAQLGDTVDRVNRILSRANTDRIERTLGNLETTSASVANLAAELGETRLQLNHMLSSASALLEENDGAAGEAIADLRYSLEAVARHVDAITRNLESTTRNLSEFSLQIRRNPKLLIRGRSSEDPPMAAVGR
jgi:phospholipid/cholesterol/gamma-HCH transport system substrate-binding protein